MATILIVEEHAPTRRRLAALLGRLGHLIIRAATRGQALEAIRSRRPDLLLLDILMSHRSGYQFVHHLHEHAGLPLPRVAFVTAPYMKDAARQLARCNGVDSLITDTTNAAALQVAIDTALGQPLVAARLPITAGSAASEAVLRPLLGRLRERVAQLETSHVHLERKTAVRAAQLDVARSAIDHEVSKRLAAKSQLGSDAQPPRALTVRDPLTGLHTRLYLEESLAREESRARRDGRPVSMMMIGVHPWGCPGGEIGCHSDCDPDCDSDCDPAGNTGADHAAQHKEVMRAVSYSLKSLSRSEDLRCRNGDHGFALVMSGPPSAILRQRADALRTHAPMLHLKCGQRVIGPLSLSIGLAVFPDHGNSVHSVLKVADAALHQARASGHGAIVTAAPEPGPTAL